MFKTMLPRPLNTLHFTKIDLGPVPLRLSNARTTKTDADGIQLDMNVEWVGKADIEMDADMFPALVGFAYLIQNHPLTFQSGRRKCTASWPTIDLVVSFDECYPTGMLRPARRR